MQLADSSADETTHAAHNDGILANATEFRKLYIGNVPYATTEAELQSFFKDYLIESTSIPKNPRTERPIGHAFVDLATPSEAERAIAELSGKKILDRIVSIQLARNPKQHAEDSDATSGGEASSGARGGRHSSTNVVIHRSSSTSDQALEVALQEQVRVEADSHEQSEEDMDMEDSYGPDPAQLAPESGSNSVVDDTSAIPGTQAQVDDGEAPASQLPNGQQNSTMDMDIVQDDENDDYEPPEATPPVDITSQVESSPFSPAPPESVTDFEQFSFGRGDLEDTAESNAEELQVNGHVPTEVKHS
jgi:RNA recognition motif-containing protein